MMDMNKHSRKTHYSLHDPSASQAHHHREAGNRNYRPTSDICRRSPTCKLEISSSHPGIEAVRGDDYFMYIPHTSSHLALTWGESCMISPCTVC